MKSKHIVFVHGIFGWGPGELHGVRYWGYALDNDSCGFVLHEAHCGPVSSYHDRACEIAAQIRGVKTDYGAQHSTAEGHRQYSKDYSGNGFVADWSAENPVIFICHSAGGHTCLKLQQLLADDYWGWGTSADWVEAIVTISSPLNGSTLTYHYGCDKTTGLLSGSLGTSLGKIVELLAIATEDLSQYDFKLDHWFDRVEIHSLRELLALLENCNFAKGRDNLAYDLTLQGCRQTNQDVITHPDTYYLAFVTEQTSNGVPGLEMHPALMVAALYQGRMVRFDSPPVAQWGYGDLHPSKWRENDGAVSSISQRYPFTAGAHPVGGEGIVNNEEVVRGGWFYENVSSITGQRFNHLSVVFGHMGKSHIIESQKMLYSSIFQLLRQLD